MLKLKNVYKYYKIGKQKKTILDNITLDFFSKGLVFILGASGSGKSTLLNIISGNLKCDTGEIFVDDLCISKFNDEQLNSYRGMVIGTIFQDYNLIDYMNVWDNIMLGFDSGLSINEINLLLKKLNIYEKRFIKVSKLSGGEKQRVAIIRALINNPDIILADEPTGSLDSENAIGVMEILKEISNDKLVIVVSHDTNLANNYATQIINIKDGKCEYKPLYMENKKKLSLKKKKIKYMKIMNLAFKNLWLKKARTIITSLALALGIVGMFTVVNLYSNFNKEILDLEQRVVSIFPVVIENGEFEIANYEPITSENKIIIKGKENYIHTNRINENYLNYLNNIKEIQYLTFDYDLSMPVISDCYNLINNKYLQAIPSSKYIFNNFDILYGTNINSKFDILLKVDSNNNVDSQLLNYFNINSDIDYKDIIGRKIRVIINDDYYIENNNYYVKNNNYKFLYNKSNFELTIVGIVKEKELMNDNAKIYYDNEIINLLIDINRDSNIVMKQITSEHNVLGFDIQKNDMLSYLGYNTIPKRINIYTDNINDKDKIIKYLDDYNNNNPKLIYIDTMADTFDLIRQFINIIGIVLIAFSIVAITISSLMIGILTGVRVLERKREIGILRNLGISKKGICKLFNIENILIGLIAIIISIIVINIISSPLNYLMNNLINGSSVFNVNYKILIIVSIINLLIIRISGIIPTKKASKMDVVSAIYGR